MDDQCCSKTARIIAQRGMSRLSISARLHLYYSIATYMFSSSIDQVDAMHHQSIPYFCRALAQDESRVRMRGKWKNVSEYIIQFIRIASCGVQQSYSPKSKYEPHLSSAVQDSLHENLSPRRHARTSSQPQVTFPTSLFRVVLPMVEYQRRERNCIREESMAVILLQRAYRGFRSRALKRRLKARLFEDMRQNNRDRGHVARLALLRRRRYVLAGKIQAAMR